MCSEFNEYHMFEARQIAQVHCERIRDRGGRPDQALRLYGVTGQGTAKMTWESAVERIAQAIASPDHMRGLSDSKDKKH